MSLGRLSAGLSHELNNPASAASRSAQLLGDALKQGDDATSALVAAHLTDAQLKNAPHYATGEEWKWDPARGRDIYDYYGVAPYWPMM